MMHPAVRFALRHSLFIFPGIGASAAAGALYRISAPWQAWMALVVAMAVLWTTPIWLRREPTGLQSLEDAARRLGLGRTSLVHFYSDF